MSAQSDQVVSRASGLGKHVNGPAGGLTILQGLDLEVRRGEAVAILGAQDPGDPERHVGEHPHVP